VSGVCQLPPKGWWCSREAGHEGPCAARTDENKALDLVVYHVGCPAWDSRDWSLPVIEDITRFKVGVNYRVFRCQVCHAEFKMEKIA